MITVYADKYLYKLSSFLPPDINLKFYDPAEGLPEQMDGIDALLIRTVTSINEESLNKIPDTLQFIGTGSAGTDHVDTQLLEGKGIAFTSAAGCNARAVAEYITTALLIWADQKRKKLIECTVGLIGAGHVGLVLKHLLDRLNIPVVAYDPPRELRETNFRSAGLEDALNADILSFHTPLTSTGSHPTQYWLDSEKLSNRSFELIINTSRGGVVNEEALLSAHSNGKIKDMIIDVWDGEPVFNDELARKAYIKTPHIAGYSIQAKLRASKLIADRFIEYFGLSPLNQTISASSKEPASLPETITNISEIMTSIHPILEYQEELVKLIGQQSDKKAHNFNKIRAEFPLRNEFSALDLPPKVFENFPLLKALFF